MTEDREPAPEEPAGAPQAHRPAPPPQSVKLFRSDELFADQRMVYIEHCGAIYRLQISSRGKLILQK